AVTHTFQSFNNAWTFHCPFACRVPTSSIRHPARSETSAINTTPIQRAPSLASAAPGIQATGVHAVKLDPLCAQTHSNMKPLKCQQSIMCAKVKSDGTTPRGIVHGLVRGAYSSTYDIISSLHRPVKS